MVDREAMARAHDVFDPIAQEHLTRPGVDIGRMFGTEGLRIRGKVYGFVVHDGALVVKVSEQRVGELTTTTAAQPMVMRDRPMREWLHVPASAAALWPALLDEAHDFVDSITP
jgi:TfoX/Sxy family transcriptional regulator of competence genes